MSGWERGHGNESKNCEIAIALKPEAFLELVQCNAVSLLLQGGRPHYKLSCVRVVLTLRDREPFEHAAIQEIGLCDVLVDLSVDVEIAREDGYDEITAEFGNLLHDLLIVENLAVRLVHNVVDYVLRFLVDFGLGQALLLGRKHSQSFDD